MSFLEALVINLFPWIFSEATFFPWLIACSHAFKASGVALSLTLSLSSLCLLSQLLLWPWPSCLLLDRSPVITLVSACVLSPVRLCNPTDCSPASSSVHGIIPGRILKWVPFPTPGDLPTPGIQPTSPEAPVSADNSLPLSHPGSQLH